MVFVAIAQYCIKVCLLYMCVCVLPCICKLLNLAAFALGVLGVPPMQCDLSVLVTLQADFPSLSHAQTSG